MTSRTRKGPTARNSRMQKQYRITDDEDEESAGEECPAKFGGVLASLSNKPPATKKKMSSKTSVRDSSKPKIIQTPDRSASNQTTPSKAETPTPPSSVVVVEKTMQGISPLTTQPTHSQRGKAAKTKKDPKRPGVQAGKDADEISAMTCEIASPTERKKLSKKQDPNDQLQSRTARQNLAESESSEDEEESHASSSFDDDKTQDMSNEEAEVEEETSQGTQEEDDEEEELEEDEVTDNEEEEEEEDGLASSEEEFEFEDEEFVPEDEDFSSNVTSDDDLSDFIVEETPPKRKQPQRKAAEKSTKKSETKKSNDPTKFTTKQQHQTVPADDCTHDTNSVSPTVVVDDTMDSPHSKGSKKKTTSEATVTSNNEENQFKFESSIVADTPGKTCNDETKVSFDSPAEFDVDDGQHLSFDETPNVESDGDETEFEQTPAKHTLPRKMLNFHDSPEPQMALIVDDDDDGEVDDCLVVTVIADEESKVCEEEDDEEEELIPEEAEIETVQHEKPAACQEEREIQKPEIDVVEYTSSDSVSPKSERKDTEDREQNDTAKGSQGEEKDTSQLSRDPSSKTTGKVKGDYYRQEGAVKRGKWTLGAQIGVGSFGEVYVGMDTQNGTLMAVKKFRMKGAVLKDIRREIELMRSLDHQNIVRYYGAQMDKKNLHIFQEWVPGGSVASLLDRFGPFSIEVIRSYLSQTL